MSLPSLPPGTYTIQSQESSPREVVCPNMSAEVVDTSLILVDPSSENVENAWNITGNGCIIPALHPDKNASIDTDPGNFVGAPVIISPRTQGDACGPDSNEFSIRIFWVFGIPGFASDPGTFTHSIYIEDSNQKRYWGYEANSKNIRLTTEEYYWTFIPVSSALPVAQ